MGSAALFSGSDPPDLPEFLNQMGFRMEPACGVDQDDIDLTLFGCVKAVMLVMKLPPRNARSSFA